MFAASLVDESPAADGVDTCEATLFTTEATATLNIRTGSRKFLSVEHHHELAAYYDLPAARSPKT